MPSDLLCAVSETAEGRACFEPAPPVRIIHHVVVSAYGVKPAAGQNVADTATAGNGFVGRAEGIELHAVIVRKDVITEEQGLFENIEGEPRRVTVDMKSLDAVLGEILRELMVESKWTTDLVVRVSLMNAHFGAEMLPVEIRGAEKMVMREEDLADGRQRSIEAGGAVDPAGVASRFDAIGGMLQTERWLRVEPGYLVVDRCRSHPEAVRAFFRGNKSFFVRSAKGAVVGMKAGHVVSAHETDILFTGHRSSLPG